MESQRQRIDISRSVLGREELRAPVRQQLQHHKRKILKIYPIAALSIIHTLTGIVMTLTGTALATYPKKVVDDLPMLGIIGICVGIPVFITGILGIMLYRDPKNSCKIVCNLLISILTFFVSLVGIMFHTIAVSCIEKGLPKTSKCMNFLFLCYQGTSRKRPLKQEVLQEFFIEKLRKKKAAKTIQAGSTKSELRN